MQPYKGLHIKGKARMIFIVSRRAIYKQWAFLWRKRCANHSKKTATQLTHENS
jgi:hypothetical protein